MRVRLIILGNDDVEKSTRSTDGGAPATWLSTQ